MGSGPAAVVRAHTVNISFLHSISWVCLKFSRDRGYMILWLHNRVFQDVLHQMSNIGRKQLLYLMYHPVGLRNLRDRGFGTEDSSQGSPPSALCVQLSCVCYKDLSSIATWQ